jgi:anti-sigma B factor antagonist
MEITSRNEGRFTLVRMSGDLDVSSSPGVIGELDRLLEDGRHHLVLDLESVPFIDSSGLSALVRLLKQVRARGGSLRLATLQPPVRQVFELTRLARSFDLYPDVAEALRSPGR